MTDQPMLPYKKVTDQPCYYKKFVVLLWYSDFKIMKLGEFDTEPDEAAIQNLMFENMLSTSSWRAGVMVVEMKSFALYEHKVVFK